jgi:hypothetical protein
MKKIVFSLLILVICNVSKAQKEVTLDELKDLPTLIKTSPTLNELIKQLVENTGYKVLDASQNGVSLTDQDKRPLPRYDYSYADGNCCYIMHAYIHSFLGLEYGEIYYVTEVVGCI